MMEADFCQAELFTLAALSGDDNMIDALTTPGKDHTSHRLVLMGATQRESVLILYLVCCALGVAAMFLTQASIIEGYFIGALLLCCGVYALWRLEQVQGDFVRRSRRASTGTEPATLSDQASKE